MCRQVLEEALPGRLCSFAYYHRRGRMASGIRQIYFEEVCPFFLDHEAPDKKLYS
jgi:hypothetical protein